MADTSAAIIWVDAAGKTRLTTLRGSASLATVEGDLLAKSNAAIARWWEGASTIPGGAATAAIYPSTKDAAELVFSTPTGTTVTVTLPAPIASIFLADGETVDPVAIATLITDCLAVLTDGSGTAVTAYVGGIRRPAGRF
jgi:hypothetical protein